MIRQVGLATIFALPIITGLVAPRAAHAASAGQVRALVGILHARDRKECGMNFCVESPGRGNICCTDPFVTALIAGESLVIDPGETQIITSPVSSGDVYTRTYYCRMYGCCSNRGNATGTCTYTRIRNEESDALAEQYGYAYYQMYCVCSCP